MCGNCHDGTCQCPSGQSVTHCRAGTPYFAYCDACGHNPKAGSLKAEAVDPELADVRGKRVLIDA